MGYRTDKNANMKQRVKAVEFRNKVNFNYTTDLTNAVAKDFDTTKKALILLEESITDDINSLTEATVKTFEIVDKKFEVLNFSLNKLEDSQKTFKKSYNNDKLRNSLKVNELKKQLKTTRLLCVVSFAISVLSFIF